jgi:hypothetical protein
LSSLFFLTQQHPYLIKDTSARNGKIASTIKKSSSFNLQDDSDDGEEKGLVNLFVHRKHCVRLFLLQCLFQIIVQSNVFGLSDEFPTRPLVLQNLDPIICLLETALAEASFALSEFFISENPPIIPLMDSFFGNSTLPKTAQVIPNKWFYFPFPLSVLTRSLFLRLPLLSFDLWNKIVIVLSKMRK